MLQSEEGKKDIM